MLYLSGAVNAVMRDDLANGAIGVMQTPRTSYALDGVTVWALDNGCYTDTYPGDAEYLRCLRKWAPHRDRCLFAAAPDVVGDAAATLARSAPMLPQIRAEGYPVALVAQDGMTEQMVPWDAVDWLFVGGSTDWKLGPDAEALIAAAVRRGKRVHVGRVNSRRRFRRFAELGCHSADGTFIAYGPDVNVHHVRRWVADPVQLTMGGLS